MNEPTRSIFCHVPFRLVAEEYNVTAYKERTSYYSSWWYKMFNNLLSDCQFYHNCYEQQQEEKQQAYEQAQQEYEEMKKRYEEEGNTYYVAGTIGVVGLLGTAYRAMKKRRTVTVADEGMVDEQAIEFPSRNREEQLEGDDYVTMS